MVKRRNCCTDLSNFNHIAETVSIYLLLVVLFLISSSFLTGVIMNRGRLLMPFLALQIIDFFMSFLIFFTSYSEIHSRQETFIQSNIAVSKLNTQSTKWKYFQMCLRLMITCSCYVEVPTYLNLKPINYITYFSTSMSSEKYIKKIIIFSVFHSAVILYKALIMWYVWRAFKGSNDEANESKDKLPLPEISKTALPSYEEATKREAKDLPPPYSTV
ncbi:lysosomal-associated transmembrane protein 5 [Eleutherodactylus coqui]|uniref:lysosomal-associated transmembrane protein 5 n=1 Tax=Eleutherodactylus coqui TaxID=57060 RepID=UPI0034624224